MTRQARPSSRQRGQAIVEFALVVPILVLLILGSVDASFLASDKLLMITASRHGSRIAAQLGGTGIVDSNNCQGTLPAGTSQATIDGEIVQSTAAVAQNSNFALIDQIDIYKPSLPSGAYKDPPGGDLIDTWRINGTRTAWIASAPQSYTLDKRCQGQLGYEAPIAVRVTWHYLGVNRIIHDISGITEYSDELMTLKDPTTP